MTTAVLEHETRAAHLALHGWVPYHGSDWNHFAIWNATQVSGFIYDEYVHMHVRVTVMKPPHDWECDWVVLPPHVVDAFADATAVAP